MSWNKEGKKLFGLYMSMKEFPFSGVVTESRVGYGKFSPIHHCVDLDEPLLVYGEYRNSIMITKGKDIFSIIGED